MRFVLGFILLALQVNASGAEFSFDSTSYKCLNINDEVGLNTYDQATLPIPCTDFRGKALVYKTWDNLDLRGSRFGSNITYGNALEITNSDLRYATFEALAPGQGFSLEGSDLRGTDLSTVETRFVNPGSGTPPEIIIRLNGCQFDSSTKLPKLDGAAISQKQAISCFGMIQL
ncbi:MAG: hypothetical protein AB7F59_02340 [Bdellovibrionales bacterium]